MRSVLNPAVVSGDRISEMCVLLTENRVPAIAIWHCFAYVDSLRFSARDSDLALTVMSTQFLAFAAVSTTALPVVNKMPEKSHDQHELEEGPLQNEAQSRVQQILKENVEGVESRKTAPSCFSQDARPVTSTPPPSTPPPSPLLPPRATAPAPSPKCSPAPQSLASPASPTLAALSTWPSNSTLRGSTNGFGTCNATAPLPWWSPINKD